MRLDKFIAHATGLSRSEVKKHLKGRAIRVNEQVVPQGAMILGKDDRVTLNQQPLSIAPPRYFMLYKPAGVVCANSDAEHPTVIDLMEEPQADSLQIAGRLDKDTTGLVLLTDDGQWNHQLTSPARGKQKTYQIETAEALTPALVDTFARGILLKGEKHPCRPAKLHIHSSHSASLIITEGKYHQVKRMFAACGNKVTSLHRSAIGAVCLDPTLAPGDYRPLSAEELNLLDKTS